MRAECIIARDTLTLGVTDAMSVWKHSGIAQQLLLASLPLLRLAVGCTCKEEKAFYG